MNEANKFKLGAFLLIAITLLIVGFLSAGIMQIFAPKYRAMTVLNTSVEGLAVGSPVKYLGMPVGKITGMAMRESDGNIAVYFEIFPSAVEAGDPDGDGPGYDALNISAIMRNKNMMCFINAAGIMGGSYLELSINDSSQPSTPHLDITPPPDVSYIPSRPSHIGNAIQNISRMLDELEKVNFIQLADKLNETLDNMSGLLNQSELRNTLKSINTICNNLENSISRLQVVLSDSNVAKLNRSIDNLDAGIQEFRSSLNGKTLSELRVRSTCGVTITRINRSGIDLVASGNLQLQIGDRVTVVGPELSVAHAERLFGNSLKRLNHPNLIPIFTGIALGVLLGSISFWIPGIPQPVKLGLAGGPLIVAILIGRYGPHYKLVTYTTMSANLMLREVGISLFLAGVGLGAGEDFVPTLVAGGYVWIAYGAVITIVPLLLAGLFGRFYYKLNYYTLIGVLSGASTNPPALAYSTEQTTSDAPSVGYATVYPLSMFLRVLAAQLLILIFG